MAKRGTKTATPRLRFPEFRDDRGWITRNLGDVAVFSSGGTPSKAEPDYWNGDIPWISASSMYETSIADSDLKVTSLAIGRGTRLAPKGSLLILVRGSMLFNRVPMGIAAVDVAFNQDVKALSLSSEVDAAFLLNQLLAISPRISINETGIGAGKIETDVLTNLPIFAPETAEQQKIADCLTSLDEVIAAQGRKVEALKAHKRGLMQQLFPREGETRPRLRFPEFRDAPEWKPSVLADVCRPQQWRTISSSELTEDGYPVYGANGFIGRYPSFNHEFETVAVTCRGSTCGEVLLIPPKSYITGNSMCLDEIDATKHSYHFIFHLLKHRGLDDVISGSAQPQIVGQAIKKLKLLLPDVPEQQRIADCLASLDTRITAETHQLAALKTHKQGLMQQLFPSQNVA